MEDYEIVDLYWARSESAIAETQRKYGRMLTGISTSLVPTAEDAEECVSDTYLAAWNRMPEERPIYLGAFLSKIVRRISIDRFRAAQAEKRGGRVAGLTEELTDCIPSDCNLQDDYDNRRLGEALNRFVRSLDEEKRYIFVRRYYYSDTVADIALALRTGEGRVKVILHRLRASLKQALEQEGIAI